MRRVLIALAMIAACVFVAAPAIAQEDSTGSAEPPASTEAPTTPPSEDPPSEDPPSQEEVPESPSAPETTEPKADANAPDGEGGFEALAVVEDVTICHRRSAETNPYGPQAITVSVNSIFNPNNGHDTHNGPVFPTPTGATATEDRHAEDRQKASNDGSHAGLGRRTTRPAVARESQSVRAIQWVARTDFAILSIGRDADLPMTVVKPESHRGRWAALGAAALVGAAILGRRHSK